MNAGTLLIRADASASIGTGHVMRCLALAQAWQDRGGRATFAMAECNSSIEARLAAEGCTVLSVSGASGTKNDAAQTIALAHEQGADWLVLDGYSFGADYQSALKSAKLKVLSIDDYGHAEHYAADLVLNQNISASGSLYANRQSYTELLLGAHYCLLRREFSRWQQWKREFPFSAHRVLVTMGGSDPENVTARVIEALMSSEIEGLEAIVIVGGGNPHFEQLQRLPALESKNISIRKDVTNIGELMAWADVAISGAGSTCWELCLLGLPAILIDLADNQKPVARELNSRGCAVHLCGSSRFRVEELLDRLVTLMKPQELRAAMSDRSRKLVDGKGAQRVAAIMLAGLRVRQATSSDKELLWHWANDAVVRGASFSTSPIPWEQHSLWFANKMGSPDRDILIGENSAGKAVGQFRLDWHSGQEGEIDVSISAENRGAGYGSLLIELGVNWAFARRGERLHAFVKTENQASRRAFEQAGFTSEGEEIMHNQRVIHYIRTKDFRNA